MIDRIRQDIQERLDQLLTEAERLRQALKALGGEAPAAASRATGTRAAASRARSATASSASRARTGSGTRARGSSSASRSRGSAGGTKNSVLKALADANGGAMTASEVASATGLGRASVSTTLSKLAKSGEVAKAQRGYQLSSGTPVAAGTAASDGAPGDA